MYETLICAVSRQKQSVGGGLECDPPEGLHRHFYFAMGKMQTDSSQAKPAGSGVGLGRLELSMVMEVSQPEARDKAGGMMRRLGGELKSIAKEWRRMRCVWRRTSEEGRLVVMPHQTGTSKSLSSACLRPPESNGTGPAPRCHVHFGPNMSTVQRVRCKPRIV